MTTERCSTTSGDGRAQDPAPGGGDPLPPPGRLLGQRDGRLEGARGGDPRGRHADGGGARDLALLPAPDLRGLAVLGVHDGPRALEGGVRRDPRSRSPTSTTSTARTARSSTPRPSSRRSACTTSPTTTREWEARTRLQPVAVDTAHLRSPLRPRRAALLPGGVNSPVRAMRSIGREHPIFIERGEGFELIDVDGNRYVDWVCSWGPLILGHAASRRRRGGDEAAANGGRASARRPRARSSSRPRSATAFASVEMVRMVNRGPRRR